MTPSSATLSGLDSPIPHAATGAMDALLDKLRAAAPQTRDTRDRRRRARLQTRNQVRVASGQNAPETGDQVEESELLNPVMTGGSVESAPQEDATSEGEDIADRAASLLQGLRHDGDAEPSGPKDDALRVRRRRESADDERNRRRGRRRGAGTSTDQTAAPPIAEEGNTDATESTVAADPPAAPPTTIVVPPSPTTSEREVHGAE